MKFLKQMIIIKFKFFLSIINKINLVDRYLIIFMIIILAQMTYTIASNITGNDELTKTDSIIRTTLSSILGYFLSANFIGVSKTNLDGNSNANSGKMQYENLNAEYLNTVNSSPLNNNGIDIKKETKVGFIQNVHSELDKTNENSESTSQINQLEFSDLNASNEIMQTSSIEKEVTISIEKNNKFLENDREKIQISIVALIGIYCFIVMVLNRDFGDINNNSMLVLGEFRDIGCASVGFLIGYPSSKQQ